MGFAANELVCPVTQTEVVKGPCGSVGMTFRHVPASEGDVVRVSIETVTPNSPAALADLQRGDRLIAIAGVAPPPTLAPPCMSGVFGSVR